MKKAALLLLLALFSTTAHAQWEAWPEVWLGQPVKIADKWYVPLMVNNVDHVPIRHVGSWATHGVVFTGTLGPDHLLGSSQNLPGDYWVGASGNLQPLSVPYDSKLYHLGASGGNAEPRGSGNDCSSYPTNTTGVLVYYHVKGSGSMRLTQNIMSGGHAWCQSGPNAVQLNCWSSPATEIFLDIPPTGGGEEGGEEVPQLPGMTAEAEGAPAAKTAVKRSTWARVKSYYR